MQDSNVKKILYNEVAFVIGIIGVTFGVINWIYSPAKQFGLDIALIKKDISTINTNHLTHLQNYAEEIKEMKKDDEISHQEIEDIEKKLDLILYKLEKR